MRKITNLKGKLLVFAAYVLVIAIFYFGKLPCVYMWAFNVPCPFCGMTRAYLSLFSLDIIGAFKYNAMFWGLPALWIIYMLDGKLFKNEKLNKAVLYMTLIGFLLNWIIKLVVLYLF